MNDEQLPPLSDELRAVIDEAGPPPAPPPELVESMWKQIWTTAAGVGAGFSAAAVVGVGAAALTAGVVVGVVVDRQWLRPEPVAVVAPSVVAVPPVVALPAAPPVAAPTGVAPPTVTPPAVAPPVRRSVPAPSAPDAAVASPEVPSDSPARDTSLAGERTLVEMARTALRRGEAQAALDHADTHARQFPSGQLAEERDVVRVQALLRLGRRDDARAAAQSFQRQYPDSLLMPAIAPALK